MQQCWNWNLCLLWHVRVGTPGTHWTITPFHLPDGECWELTVPGILGLPAAPKGCDGYEPGLPDSHPKLAIQITCLAKFRRATAQTRNHWECALLHTSEEFQAFHLQHLLSLLPVQHMKIGIMLKALENIQFWPMFFLHSIFSVPASWRVDWHNRRSFAIHFGAWKNIAAYPRENPWGASATNSNPSYAPDSPCSHWCWPYNRISLDVSVKLHKLHNWIKRQRETSCQPT